MNRYDMVTMDLMDGRAPTTAMEERDEGEYVDYEDHVLALMEQDKQIAALRAENAHLKRALELVDALRNKERNLPL